jgi:hypothetical protein
MEGARQGLGEADGAVRALTAGCDLLLYPADTVQVVAAIERAAASGELERRRLDASLERRASALERAGAPRPLADADLAAHRGRASELARAAIRLVRGELGRPPGAVELLVVDDDTGGPYPVPPRTAFAAELGVRGAAVGRGGQRVVLVFADVKAWKARATLSAASRRALADALVRPATTVVFGHPRLAEEVPGPGPVLCAWSGDVIMQRAAAERVLAA